MEGKSFEFLVKTQLSVEKVRIAIQTRGTHLKKKGRIDGITEELLTKLKEVEHFIDGTVAKEVKDHPAYDWFSLVYGVGKENIGKVVGQVRIKPDPNDPEIAYADTISALWKFAGFSVNEDGKIPEIGKGHKHPYNAKLKSMCWRLAGSLVRVGKVYDSKFYRYYVKEKAKETQRCINEGLKIVPSAELPEDENEKKYEPEGVISLGHVDNRAKRKMIKLFLSCLWIVWREAEGLSVTKPYVIDKLKHSHYYDPWEFVDKPKSKRNPKS